MPHYVEISTFAHYYFFLLLQYLSDRDSPASQRCKKHPSSFRIIYIGTTELLSEHHPSESINVSINGTECYRMKIATARRRATLEKSRRAIGERPRADVLMRCKSTDITIGDIKFIARLTTNRNLHRIPTCYRR